MITLLVTIGMIVLVVKLIGIAIKLTFGILGGVLAVVSLPLVLIGLLLAGLATIALPVLVIALIAAFIVPALT